MDTPPSATLRPPSADEIFKNNSGTALESEGLTWKLLLAGVAYALMLYSAQTLLFIFIRTRFPRVYRPRTYLIPEEQCVEQPPEGLLAWLKPVWSTTDDLVIQKCGFDAFLFLRYLRMMLRVFLPVTCVVLPVLAPINRLSGKSVRPAFLDIFSISNVAPQHVASRLWTHWGLGTLVVAWVCYVVHDETLAYIKAKQRHTSGPSYRAQPSANTILVANIPEKLLTSEKLEKVFDVFPGGVRDVHINKDARSLSSMLSRRDQIVKAIELAETRLIAMCVAKHTGVHRGRTHSVWGSRTCFDVLRRRETVEVTKGRSVSHSPVVQDRSSENRPLRRAPKLGSGKQDNFTTLHHQRTPRSASCIADSNRKTGAAWRRYVKPQDRETIRLPVFAKSWCPPIPFLGKKADRIHYLQDRLRELNQEIESSTHDQADDRPLLNNAFVRFNDQIAAHLACQSVVHGAPYCMAPRMLDVNPSDVIWDNLALGWRQRWIRMCISLCASTGLIVLYAVPVAFTSFLANLDVLASNVSWLSWLADWPDAAKSVIQGVLPPAFLQVILLLVPVVYRYLMHFQGASTGVARELGVQNWFFLFLFVQMFLVVSISGGLVGFLSNAAQSPKSVPSQLAQTLPKAANYFMSYVLVKALTGSSGALLQPITLSAQLISDYYDVTPRQKWQRQARFASIEWARLFPPLTNIAVIGIAFSVIAPLVLPFVSFAFALYWVAYRYNVLYVYRYDHESGGCFFVAALNQLFTGLYVMEVCLIGHFFVTGSDEGSPTCVPHGIAMIIVLVLTAAYQVFMNRTFRSLMEFLPVHGDVYADVLAVSQSEDGGRYDQGERSDESEMGTPPVLKRPGESSRSGRSGHEKDHQATKYQASAKAIERPAVERNGLAFWEIHESADEMLRSYESAPKAIVWIPRDEYGISTDEIRNAAEGTDSIRMSDDGAWLDDEGKVKLDTCPPDQSVSSASR